MRQRGGVSGAAERRTVPAVPRGSHRGRRAHREVGGASGDPLLDGGPGHPPEEHRPPPDHSHQPVSPILPPTLRHHGQAARTLGQLPLPLHRRLLYQ